MWVRGLKRYIERRVFRRIGVAPHVGAWIETSYHQNEQDDRRRTPCGCVD